MLNRRLRGADEPLDVFIGKLAARRLHRVSGTAVFMIGRPTGTPHILYHHLTHNQALHEQVIVLTVLTEEIPWVARGEQVTATVLTLGFTRVVVRYGFMQKPDVPAALRQCQAHGLRIPLEHVTYYLARETVISTPRESGMMRWQEKLFSFMSRNSLPATAFFNIPAERVVELGQQVEI